MLPQGESKKLLISVLKKENEEKGKTFSEEDNNCVWKYVDKFHQKFLKALDSKDINKARKFIEIKKYQLNFFYKKLLELYDKIENINIEENKIPEIKDEMEIMKIWSYQERRKAKIRNACRRIKEYIEYVEGLKEELNSNNVEDILKLGTLLHLFIDRASNVLTMVDASLFRTLRILELSTDEEEYSRQINENKRKIISAVARYVSSLEMSKHFSNITLPTREKVGIHGEYDKDYIGESDLIMGLNEVLSPTFTLVNCDEKDLEIIINKVEEVAKDWGLDEKTKRRILNKFNKVTELVWDLYGLSGIENICVEVEKIEAVVENRMHVLKELYQKGKCRAIPEFQIICEVEPHTLQIVDVLIRFMSEKFGKETTLKNEINKAEQWYMSKYSPCIRNIAGSILELCNYIDEIKDKKTVQYHDLLETYNQLKSNISELFSPAGIMTITDDKPNYLIREELKSSLRKIEDWIQKYRVTSQYSPEIEEPINTLVGYAEKAVQKLKSLEKVSENPMLV